MNDKQIHERAIHKAESQISFIQLEMDSLEQETPYMSYTIEMIEAQQAFKCKEIDTWRYMLDCVKIVETQRMIREEKPNFEIQFGETTKYI
jgi:hypothetical protein